MQILHISLCGDGGGGGGGIPQNCVLCLMVVIKNYDNLNLARRNECNMTPKRQTNKKLKINELNRNAHWTE